VRHGIGARAGLLLFACAALVAWVRLAPLDPDGKSSRFKSVGPASRTARSAPMSSAGQRYFWTFSQTFIL
jgi:hypothetical protein